MKTDRPGRRPGLLYEPADNTHQQDGNDMNIETNDPRTLYLVPESKVTPTRHLSPHGESCGCEDEDSGAEEIDVPAELERDFKHILKVASLPDIPLTVRRGTILKGGYVTGRIAFYGTSYGDVVITTAPNSDRAAMVKTLIHEAAHAVAREYEPHGEAFCKAMVDIASAVYGDSYFDEARRLIKDRDSWRDVNAWVRLGLRACFNNEPVPRPAGDQDEESMVGVIRRIQKLQRLANRHPGEPEAISAASRADTLIIQYGLRGYAHRIPQGDLSDEMVDQSINVGNRKPWRWRLAFALARHNDVFPLKQRLRRFDPEKGKRVKFTNVFLFGRYSAVVNTVHLYETVSAKLKRQCEEHIDQEGFKGAERISQRAAYLHSAVTALRERLRREMRLEQKKAQENREGIESKATDLARDELKRAEEFAATLTTWTICRGPRYQESDAGAKAGKSVSLSRGVGGSGPRALR